MIRFKVFSVGFSDEPDELDARVNQWLEEKGDRIQVVDSKVTTCVGENVLGSVFINATVIVWYDELEEV